MWVGLGLIFRWSENKFSYFGVAYKYLRVGMEVAISKELFIIVYISNTFLSIYCNFSIFIYVFIHLIF